MKDAELCQDTHKFASSAKDVTSNPVFTNASPLPPVVDIASVNPGSTIERSFCLTVSVGASAAAECGDLRVVHQLPTTRTMNKARTPTLLYNSQSAHPFPLVAANVTLPASSLIPDSVTATLTINSIPKAKGKWAGNEWVPGQTRRIVVAFDDLKDTTGIYSYTLEVRNWFPNTNQPTSVTGQLGIVNRKNSPFGAGWWLAGLEKLNVAQMVWIGGDGSLHQYQSVSPNVWAAANLDHPDTLRRNAGGNYTRYDRDSLRVVFDTVGNHIATISRQGHQTSFAYANGRLVSITLPPAVAGKVYQFTYDANNKLQIVSSPGPNGPARFDTVTVSNGRLVTIRNPDNTMVSFSYDSTFGNRIASRTDRRGAITTFSYDNGNKLTLSYLNMGPGKSPIVRTVTPLESRGLPVYGNPGPISVDTAAAYTKVDGPRTEVSDTTVFWLDRFGAPRRIVDALGNSTLVSRGSIRWPALVTRVQSPNGRIVAGVFDSLRANLQSVTDSSANATTRYEWDVKWDRVRKVTHPTGDSVTFSYDPATGNLLWQQDGRGSLSRVSFSYNAANQVISATQPTTPAERYGYDASGNLDSVTTPRGFLTIYQNDEVGRTTLVSQPIDTMVPASLRQVQQTFLDINDRDTLSVSAGPSTPPYASAESIFARKAYNPNGQLDSLSRWSHPDTTHIGVITTRWKYDTAGRTVAEVAPDQAIDSMFYDLAGNDTLTLTRRQLKIRMAYDGLNRLTTRILPGVSYGQRASGIHGTIVPTDYAPYMIPSDTQTFTYDAAGRLTSAYNANGRIRRGYYPNGLLQGDSIWIRTVQDSDFSKHFYVVSNHYDLNGHRTRIDIPAQLGMFGLSSDSATYDPQFGALATVRDLQDSVYTIGYTPRTEVASIAFPGQYTQRFSYDADGRPVVDSILNNGGTTPPRINIAPVRAISYTYDARAKLLHGADPKEWQDTINMNYSGLGHVVQSSLIEHGQDPGCPGARYSVSETFRYDGLGNRARADNTEILANAGCGETTITGNGSAYQNGTGRLLVDTLAQSGTPTTYYYNAAGDAEFSQNLGGPSEERASYYAADGHVVAVDLRTAQGPQVSLGFWTRTLEEYRYDALGRRIWVRSRKSCQDSQMTITQGTECKTSLLRRTIWDGNQILAEIQMPGDSTSRDIPYWENDTAAVQLQPLAVGAGTGDPSRYFGRVVYSNALELDHPISLTRYQYVYAINSAGQTKSPAVVVPRFTIVPFWNALGDAPLGAFSTGSVQYCTPPSSTTECVGVSWDYFFSAYDRQRGIVRDNWQGSLLESGRDKSGLEFRRNRLYDPETGRFTQEDPIGLGGGLNLYGFAAGDPVNFSDPLGTCPICVAIVLGSAIMVYRQYLQNISDGNDPEEGLERAHYTGMALGAFGGAMGELGTIGVGTESEAVSARTAGTSWTTVQRAGATAEAEATANTSLVRGGRVGEDWVTDAVPSSATAARQSLSLPNIPQVRMTIQVPADAVSAAKPVIPGFGQPGGGTERLVDKGALARLFKLEPLKP